MNQFKTQSPKALEKYLNFKNANKYLYSAYDFQSVCIPVIGTKRYLRGGYMEAAVVRLQSVEFIISLW